MKRTLFIRLSNKRGSLHYCIISTKIQDAILKFSAYASDH